MNRQDEASLSVEPRRVNTVDSLRPFLTSPQGQWPARLYTVTPEERTRMNELVLQIQIEKDHPTFIKLVKELTDLIAEKDHRFPDKSGQS